MQATSHQFKENVARALEDAPLQDALGRMRAGFTEKRRLAAERLPEFDALRDEAVRIKDHTLANLDAYLELFESNVVANGGTVHWAPDAEAARQAVLQICALVGARTVTKGKSMIGEELGLNAFLEDKGITPVETDLGEYIIQLRDEPPSHLIAPAIHVSRDQIATAFRTAHTDRPDDRALADNADLLAEARAELRSRFLAADVGITGANFLIAETGSTVIVTNEGNGDLTQTLPRIHIVIASLEKVVPTLEDASTLLRVLARSATGQDMSVYTSFSTGPRRSDDLDGPEQFHVILLDGGRSKLTGTEFQDVLRCIRCGACLNHCPVYGAVGGHAYGWVYSGPIGKVLTPALLGIDQAPDLPNASSFCGRCEEVCPVRIPLPKMMRHWREQQFQSGAVVGRARWALRLWAWAATHPFFYRLGTGLAMRWLAFRGRRHGGRFKQMIFAGNWTKDRDLPAPQGRSFQSQWKGPRRIKRRDRRKKRSPAVDDGA